MADYRDRIVVMNKHQEHLGHLVAGMLLSQIQDFTKGLTDSAIEFIAERIPEMYPDVTKQDLYYFSRAFLSAEYGKIYGDVDVPQVLSAFHLFYEQRENACADKREREHRERLADELPTDEEMINAYLKARREAKESIENPPKGPVLNIPNLSI